MSSFGVTSHLESKVNNIPSSFHALPSRPAYVVKSSCQDIILG